MYVPSILITDAKPFRYILYSELYSLPEAETSFSIVIFR